MSAQRIVWSSQFVVRSCLFLAFISLAAYFLFSPQSAYAATLGENCEFSDPCNLQGGGTGQRPCPGTWQPVSESSDELSCKWVEGGSCDSVCQPIGGTAPAPSPSPGATNPAPGSSVTNPSSSPVTSPLIIGDKELVNKDNYKAPQNANYTVLNLEHTFLCELAGTSPIDKCLGSTKGSDGKIVTFLYEQNPGGGATGALAGVIGTMYTPPTSTVQYLAGVIKNFGFSESAYAQTFDVPGSGASIISPVLTLWQAVRNISYLAFILIFLGVGFMIMFRQKINPQTVVTAQAALPGLVIGLLLVTFSYFIAALIIDLAFVGIPLVTNIIIQANPNSNTFGNATELQRLAQDSNILQMFGTTVTRIDLGKIAGGTFGTIWSTPATIGASSLIMAIVGGIIGSIIPGPGTLLGAGIGAGTGWLILPGIISIVIPIILIVALVIQMFKLLMALISTYLQLLVATLTGPFVILASSLPGKGGGIGEWLKNLLANALVFPAVFAAFLFAGMILATKPEAWSKSPPLFGGLSLDLIGVLLGYGVIMALPGIPDAVRGAFGIKPQQGGIIGAALGGFTAGFGTLSGAAKKGYGVSTGTLKREKEAYQKEKSAAAVGPEGAAVAGTWRERLFKKGLPF